MRYAIDHRRPAPQSTGRHVIRCLIWLSADEKEYLRARPGYDPPSAPFLPVVPDGLNMKWLRGTGRTIIVVGVALLVVPGIFAWLGLALLGVGILIEIYGWAELAGRYRRISQPDVGTALRQVLNHPRFALSAGTAEAANALELQTGDALRALQAMLAARNQTATNAP